MKLHDLQVGDRFSFTDKHRGKVFEVTYMAKQSSVIKDVATGGVRIITQPSRFEVNLIRVVELTPAEEAIIVTALMIAIKTSAEDGEPESSRNEINRLYLKIKGNEQR